MELKEYLKGKNVLIIGCPASGKTYLAEQLKDDTHHVIHTDDYIKYGYKEALYVLLEDMKKISSPTIIEGVLGYRLLRKGVELDCYYPDIVIKLQISKARMLRTYAAERSNKQVRSLEAFNKSHQTILLDYQLKLGKKSKPQWITLTNNY